MEFFVSQVISQKDGVIFELLDGTIHDRASFDCGLPVLNDYINNYATQHQNKNLTKVHVATNSLITIKPIYGYYTLCASEIYYESIPKQISKKLPNNYTIPSIKIGRLARDINITPRGFGA